MRKLVQKQLFLLGVLLVFCASLQAKSPLNGADSLKNAILVAPIVENAATLHAFPELEKYLQQNNSGANSAFQQREIEPEFTEQYIERNFVVPEVVQSDRDNAQATFGEIDRTQNFIDFLSPAVLVNLPVGMKKSFGNADVVIGVSKAIFYPDHSELTVFCKVTLPQGNVIFFGASNVKLSNGGGIIGDANLVLLGDFPIPINGGNSMITLKGGFDMKTGIVTNLTYAKIGCAGLQEIGLAANVSFPRSLLTPLDANLNPITDETVKVQGDFSAVVSDWNDILTKINVSNAFSLTGYNKLAFTLTDAVIDLSDKRNDASVVFPQNYANYNSYAPNTWRGVFIKKISVILPPEFKANGSSERKKFDGANVLIDNLGFSGYFGYDATQNTPPGHILEGTLSGWDYTLDAISIQIVTNSFRSGTFTGQVYLPVTSKSNVNDGLTYSATFTSDNNYIFNVKVNKEIGFDLWQARATIVAPSAINVSLVDGKFRPVANLNGSINVNIGNGTKTDLSFKGITFQGLVIQTVSPYFQIGPTSYTDNQLMANFPIGINSFGISATGNEVSISAGVSLNLMEAFSNKFSATTNIKVVGKFVNDEANEHQSFVYDRFDVDKIGINADFAAFTMNGSISFNRNHPILGNGFSGDLSVTILGKKDPATGKSKDQGIKAVVAFGSTTFRYWYVDMLVSGLSIPVGGPSFVITGLGGGASYHMIRTTTGVIPSACPTGLGFTTDINTGLNLRAMAEFKVGSNYVATGDATLDISFNTSGGLSRIGLYGKAVVMPSADLKSQYTDTTVAKARASAAFKSADSSILSNLDTFKTLALNGQFKTLAAKYSPQSATANEGAGSIIATLGIEYDFTNSVLDGQFEVKANLAGGLIRGNSYPNDASKIDVAGTAKIHFSPGRWYILMGTPQNPLSVRLAVGPITVNTGTYFMVGDSLGASPPPPAEVARILNTQLQVLDYMRNLNDLGGGRGLAFGAKVNLDANIDWLIFYARFKAGIGFDIMVKDYGDHRCVGYNKPIGINGWYANGQAYAYLEGDLGIHVSLAFFHKDISIISAGAAILIQAKLPSPTWFSGRLAARYSVLGGLVSGGFSCNVTFGDNCELVNNSGDAKLNFDFITDMQPEDKSEEVDVMIVPQTVFRYPVDIPFVGDNDADGNPTYYGSKLDAFTLTANGVPYVGQLRWNNDKNTVFFESKEILAPYTKFTAYAKVSFYKVRNGVWQPLNQFEEKTINFITGSAPSIIPLSNVEYAYPVPSQKYFYANEYNKGFIKLKKGQFLLLKNLESSMKVKFTDKNNIAQILPCSYDQDAKTINFDLPKLTVGNGNYKFEVTIPTAMSLGVKAMLGMANGTMIGSGTDYSSIKATVDSVSMTKGANNSTGNENINVSSGAVLKNDVASNTAAYGGNGNGTTSETSPLIGYDFTVSTYGTFVEKMRVKKLTLTPNSLDYAEDFGLGKTAVALGKNNPISEGFDLTEIKGTKFTSFVQLVKPEATLTDDYYTKYIKPIVYTILDGGYYSISREIDGLGIPPAKALLTRSDFIANLTAEGFDNSTTTVNHSTYQFPYHYDLPKFYYQDYSQLLNAVVGTGGSVIKTVADCDQEDYESRPCNKTKEVPDFTPAEFQLAYGGDFPKMPYGVYPAKLHYVLPNGIETSSFDFVYNYPTTPPTLPIAYPDMATTPQNTVVTILPLANDIVYGGCDSAQVIIKVQPAHGVLTMNGNTVIYTPVTGYVGLDNFTYTINAACGESNRALVNLIVNSGTFCKTPPNIICPQNITVTPPTGSASAIATWVALATDNCVSGRNVNVVSIPASGSSFAAGTVTTDTCIATDSSKNVSRCTFTITTNASSGCTKSPRIVCPSNITVTAPSGSSTATATWTTTATDSCLTGRTVSVVSVPASGSNFTVGSTTTVTSTATDSSNNKSSCTFTVSATSGTPSLTGCDQLNVSSSNGGIVLTGLNPGAFLTTIQVYTSLFALVYDVNAGQGTTATSYTIPSSVGLVAGQTYILRIQVFVYNNSTIGTNTCTLTPSITISTASNCTKLPTIVCPSNITVNVPTGSTSAPATWAVTATDNCANSAITATSIPQSGSSFAAGTTTTVSSSATDKNSKIAACSFTVTALAPCISPPTITCPQNIVIPAVAGATTATASWTTTAKDNCVSGRSVAVVSTPASGSTFASGTTTTVTSTATDANNIKSTCTFTVTANAGSTSVTGCDLINVSSSNGNIVLTGLNPGAFITTIQVYSSTFALVHSVNGGNGITATSYTIPSSVGLVVGQKYVLRIQVFVYNNPPTIGANTCTLTPPVTISNSAPSTCTYVPSIVCPSNITVTAPTGNTTATATWATIATDNCVSGRNVSVVSVPASGSSFAVGTNTVTSTAIDSSGNRSTCTFAVTVNQSSIPCTKLPKITCPSNITVTAPSASSTATATWTTTATDSCVTGRTVSVVNVPASGSSFTVGTTTTVTSTATDLNSNKSSCSFTVTANAGATSVTGCDLINVSSSNGNIVLTGLNPGAFITTIQVYTSTFALVYSVNGGNGITATSCTIPSSVGLVAGQNYVLRIQVFVYNNPPTIGANTCTLTPPVTILNTAPVTCTNVPGIACPSAINITAPIGNTSATATWTTTATDNCVTGRNVPVTSVPASGSSFVIGSTTVTSTAIDSNGNRATCTFTVNVSQGTACLKSPKITCPSNITVTAPSGSSTATATWTTTATDSCVTGRTVSVVSVPTSGSSFTVGSSTTVTSTATDLNNNKSYCSFTVTANAGTTSVTGCDLINVSSSNGGIVLTGLNPGAFITTIQVYTSTFALLYSVNGGNGITATSCTIPSSVGLVAGQNYVLRIQVFVYNNPPTIGANTCTLTPPITISNTIACTKIPGIVCPSNITVTAPSGSSTATATWTTTATDSCVTGRTVSVVSLPASGSSFAAGTTTVRSTATDANSNTSTCTFNVTTLLPCTLQPSITCPQNMTVNAAIGSSTATASWTTTASDNCVSGRSVVVVNVPASGSSFAVGTTIVTSTATDLNNNKSNCTFTVKVNQANCTSPPKITCPQNITVNAAVGSSTATASWLTTAIDSCGGGVINNIVCTPQSGSAFQVGTTTVTSTATGLYGNKSNCYFTVNVNPAPPCSKTPKITCPQNITVNAPDGSTSAPVTWLTTAIDSCYTGHLNITSTPQSGSIFNIGTSTVTSSATDLMFNQSSCNFTVTVLCTSPPSISCPQSLTVTTAANASSAIATWAPVIATDLCVGGSLNVTSTATSGSSFNIGLNTVTSSAIDKNGRTSTCSFGVTVVCGTPPTIQCPSNFTVNAPSNVSSVNVNWTPITATDNCGGGAVSISNSKESGSSFDVGTTTTVSSIATDKNYRTKTCSFTVTVVCNTPPTISCPTDITVVAPIGSTTVSASWITTAKDNCVPGRNVTVTSSPLSGSSFNVGTSGTTNIVTSTATDQDNRTSSCTFKVFANPNPANGCDKMDITSKDGNIIITGLNAGNFITTIQLFDSTYALQYSLNAGTTSTTFTIPYFKGLLPGGHYIVKTQVYTYNNPSWGALNCTKTLNVVGTNPPCNTPPSINCPPSLTIEAPINATTVNPTWTATTYADYCGGTSPSIVTSPALGSPFNIGTTTVTSTALGTGLSCQFKVKVLCTTPPSIINCPKDIVVESPIGATSAIVFWDTPTASDGCLNYGLNLSSIGKVSGSSFDIGKTQISYSTTGSNDKTASCSFNVIVNKSSPIGCESLSYAINAFKTITLNGLNPGPFLYNLEVFDNTNSSVNGSVDIISPKNPFAYILPIGDYTLQVKVYNYDVITLKGANTCNQSFTFSIK